MKKYTPMIEQYLSVKKGYPDAIVFYRLGDFYEMFFDDAKIASSELDLVLTGKSAGVEEKVPMCGVPYHAVNGYLQKLVQRGYKVAIVEQLEDPSQAKGIVKRDVVRVVTPGTVIDEINDDKKSVYIASIVDFKYGYSLIMVEMSTGESICKEIDHNSVLLIQTMLKNNIKEVVLSEDFDEKIIKLLRENSIIISYCSETNIKEEYNLLSENLKEERNLEAFGLILNYLESTQKRMLDHLNIVIYEREDDVLYMDYSTTINLELIEPLRNQSKNDTLWTFMDKCQSAMGSRLLKKWIEKPLVDKNKIENRYDILEYFMNNFLILDDLKEHLKNIYDLQRIITKVAMKSANALDCVRLQKTLKEVPLIMELLQDPLFSNFNKVDVCTDLYDELKNAFVEDPPLITSDGGMFQDGYNEELDRLRTIQKEGKSWILSMEAYEKERTGIKTLRIGYNRVFGYYIEVSKAATNLIKDEYGYVRKQTLVNGERYITQELKEREDEILHAQERTIKLEKQLFEELLDLIKSYLPKLQKLANVLANIDCLYALSTLSKQNNYVRPTFNEDIFEIKDGRHPILDVIMKDSKYISNDILLDNNTEIEIITGPNMGGKSTYMRQIALIVIMAQVGCFVPCRSCNMPVFDKIFTRIGASDDILSGQSTFMVEMIEANNALSNATKKSLILFDEIGRGTSTYDGMALAQAMIEYIATIIHAKTLFSTHYHELTNLADNLQNVKNVHVQVHEDKEKVTFLYKVKPGVAKRSYGINVAKLANLPESVIDRAKELLKELESKKRVVQQSYQIVEMKRNDNEEKLKQILYEVNPDEMTPMQALQMIIDLQKISKE
ncbi:MAG: DNA mismatch repair protein MutS [Erysipelotrichaceae bacterium]|nr:DNA mismatch repair protein MutS [Erysipelotrichaceae bacterium]